MNNLVRQRAKFQFTSWWETKPLWGRGPKGVVSPLGVIPLWETNPLWAVGPNQSHGIRSGLQAVGTVRGQRGVSDDTSSPRRVQGKIKF